MDRKLIIAGNWKMNHATAATAVFFDSFNAHVAEIAEVDIVVCPPFTSIQLAVEATRGTGISIGAQNVHWADSGAYTGEISTEMLCQIPVEYVIIGHSERRQYFGETDENINRILKAVVVSGLKPIVCVGEVLEERKAGKTRNIVENQISKCLAGISPDEMEKIVIAYEPVWAIGTGLTATPEQAQEVHHFIRELIRSRYSDEIADRVRIQYGGSVKVANVCELMSEDDIDGALVGGASLIPEDFGRLIANCRDL